MMTFKLSNKSLDNLKGIHPHLYCIVRTAIRRSEVDFTVIEGVRSIDRQKELFAAGKSQTLNSRHLTGHAVDLAPYINGTVSWLMSDMKNLAMNILDTAKFLDIPLEWGGNWSTFKDGPHYQLPIIYYP